MSVTVNKVSKPEVTQALRPSRSESPSLSNLSSGSHPEPELFARVTSQHLAMLQDLRNRFDSFSSHFQTSLVKAPLKADAEHAAEEKQIAEQARLQTPLEVVKYYRAENGFMVLDHVYLPANYRR